MLIAFGSQGRIVLFNATTFHPIMDLVRPTGEVYGLTSREVQGGWEFVIAGGRGEGFMGVPQEKVFVDYE